MDKLFKVFLVFLLTANTLNAQSKIDSLKLSYSNAINKIMLEKNIAGASVAVISKEGILWSEHFGFANKKNEIAPNDETLYGLGSISKVFTATAVMQLNEAGQLSIDQSLKTYLPELNIKGDHLDKVTPRNVMIHHSGLPSDIFKGMFTHEPESYTATVNYINNEYMAERPNTIRAYSNPGFTLLGHTIYNVSGLHYSDYLEKNVFEPLNMCSSGVNLIEQASKTYDKNGEEKLDVLLRDTPAGGVFSSIGDMSKFVQAYLNRSSELLSETSYQEIFSIQNNEMPLDFGEKYGLSLSMTSRPHAGTLFTHTGTTMYFNAALSMAPETGLAVVLLTNSESGGALFGQVNSLLEDMAVSQGFTPKQELEPKNVNKFHTEKVTVAPEILDSYTGFYAVPGGLINVYTKRNKLYLKLQGIKMRMIPVAENEFIPKPILAGFISFKLKETRMYFEEVSDRKLLLNADNGQAKELMAAAMVVNPITDSWASMLGQFSIVNRLDGEIDYFNNYQLKEEHGILKLCFTQVSNGQKIEMALELVDENRAKVAGLGRYAGQTILLKEKGLQAFGLTLEKI